MSRELYIARGVTELGPLTEKEVRELLREGFLLPADLFWSRGMPDWEELGNLAFEASRSRGAAALVASAKQKVSSASKAATIQASKLTRKLKSLAGRGRSRLTDSTSHLLDPFTPQIQKLVSRELVRQSLTRVQAAVQEDEFMRKVFGATYDCLPKPVYRFVTEKAFIQFCMERRREILGLDGAKVETEKAGEKDSSPRQD